MNVLVRVDINFFPTKRRVEVGMKGQVFANSRCFVKYLTTFPNSLDFIAYDCSRFPVIQNCTLHEILLNFLTRCYTVIIRKFIYSEWFSNPLRLMLSQFFEFFDNS